MQHCDIGREAYSAHILAILDTPSKLRCKSSFPLSFVRSKSANSASKDSACSQLDKFFRHGGNWSPKGGSFLLLKEEFSAAEGGRAVGDF